MIAPITKGRVINQKRNFSLTSFVRLVFSSICRNNRFVSFCGDSMGLPSSLGFPRPCGDLMGSPSSFLRCCSRSRSRCCSRSRSRCCSRSRSRCCSRSGECSGNCSSYTCDLGPYSTQHFTHLRSESSVKVSNVEHLLQIAVIPCSSIILLFLKVNPPRRGLVALRQPSQRPNN
jgi:hypothetical protein